MDPTTRSTVILFALLHILIDVMFECICCLFVCHTLGSYMISIIIWIKLCFDVQKLVQLNFVIFTISIRNLNWTIPFTKEKSNRSFSFQSNGTCLIKKIYSVFYFKYCLINKEPSFEINCISYVIFSYFNHTKVMI